MRPPSSSRTPSSSINFFALRSVALKSIRAVSSKVRAEDCSSSSIIALADSTLALALRVRALAPRRSHSTSRRTFAANDSRARACASRNCSRFSRNALYLPSARNAPPGNARFSSIMCMAMFSRK
ncbi:MAG: hypothetical protein ACUVS7_14270 [Bryobacteraceae bacterium]